MLAVRSGLRLRALRSGSRRSRNPSSGPGGCVSSRAGRLRPAGCCRVLPAGVRPAVPVKRQGVRRASSPASLIPASRHNSLLWAAVSPTGDTDAHNDFGRAGWGGRWADGAGGVACRGQAGSGPSGIASRTRNRRMKRLTIAYADKPMAGYASRHRQASGLAPRTQLHHALTVFALRHLCG